MSRNPNEDIWLIKLCRCKHDLFVSMSWLADSLVSVQNAKIRGFWGHIIYEFVHVITIFLCNLVQKLKQVYISCVFLRIKAVHCSGRLNNETFSYISIKASAPQTLLFLSRTT